MRKFPPLLALWVLAIFIIFVNLLAQTNISSTFNLLLITTRVHFFFLMFIDLLIFLLLWNAYSYSWTIFLLGDVFFWFIKASHMLMIETLLQMLFPICQFFVILCMVILDLNKLLHFYISRTINLFFYA